jgi:hypothetical protein
LDPWNGSGTTTSKALSLGLNCCGFDLNPVMVVVAKARSLASAEYSSLRPLAADLYRKSAKPFALSEDDPLTAWFVPRSAAAIRGVEASIQELLVESSCYLSLKERGVDEISDLSAFFYVALFRTLRRLLEPFFTSNPTWVRRPTSWRARLRPDASTVRAIFKAEAAQIVPVPTRWSELAVRGKRVLQVASSEHLPLSEEYADFVLASPPYCTRIPVSGSTALPMSGSSTGMAVPLSCRADWR